MMQFWCFFKYLTINFIFFYFLLKKSPEIKNKKRYTQLRLRVRLDTAYFAENQKLKTL